MDSNILSKKYSDLMELASNKKDEYANAKPFPFILLEEINERLLNFPICTRPKADAN